MLLALRLRLGLGTVGLLDHPSQLGLDLLEGVGVFVLQPLEPRPLLGLAARQGLRLRLVQPGELLHMALDLASHGG